MIAYNRKHRYLQTIYDPKKHICQAMKQNRNSVYLWPIKLLNEKRWEQKYVIYLKVKDLRTFFCLNKMDIKQNGLVLFKFYLRVKYLLAI